MARKKLDLRGQAFKDVLGFTFRHWREQPWRTALIVALALLSSLADVLTPLYAGRLVDAVASGAAGDELVWSAAMTSFWLLIALGVGSTLLRQAVFQNIITFTLKMMNAIVSNAFYRVQRFSTDWHANSFAGSTVRKVTRGMWAVDILNDTLLIALLPSVVMLVGATALLGAHWPMMGLVVGAGSVLYIAVTTTLSLRYVAPAARLGNAWDTRMGGALADAVTCNAVVKAFGAETREEVRLGRVVDKWRNRTRRTWVRGTINGGVQGAMLVAMQAGILGMALLLWSRNEASVGDITFALTMFFMLQGHLRDVGMHIRNLQRSVNDMEELVALGRQPLGVDDRPGAGELRVTAGEIRFEDLTFHQSAHEGLEHAARDTGVSTRESVVGSDAESDPALRSMVQSGCDLTIANGQPLSQVALEVAAELGPETEWRLTSSAEPKDIVVLVSKEGHCLTDLLGRADRGERRADRRRDRRRGGRGRRRRLRGGRGAVRRFRPAPGLDDLHRGRQLPGDPAVRPRHAVERRAARHGAGGGRAGGHCADSGFQHRGQ